MVSSTKNIPIRGDDIYTVFDGEQFETDVKLSIEATF